ncbi:hypothetical protein C240_3025 [Enterococcus sp. 5H]|nr:hypothetical protein [Enterococcus sp. 5H]
MKKNYGTLNKKQPATGIYIKKMVGLFYKNGIVLAGSWLKS